MLNMGRYINQKESRSELQQRIAAELRAKNAARSQAEANAHDGVNDSKYIEGTKQTSNLAWVWLLVFLVMIGCVVATIVWANS